MGDKNLTASPVYSKILLNKTIEISSKHLNSFVCLNIVNGPLSGFSCI